MARQAGNIFITGTIQDITFYRMDGRYFARMKSSLTGKRVKTDPAFRVTMALAGIFGQASRIASLVYASVPREERQGSVRYELQRTARWMLHEGFESEEAVAVLMDLLSGELGDRQQKTRRLPSDAAIARHACAGGRRQECRLRMLPPKQIYRASQRWGNRVVSRSFRCTRTGTANLEVFIRAGPPRQPVMLHP